LTAGIRIRRKTSIGITDLLRIILGAQSAVIFTAFSSVVIVVVCAQHALSPIAFLRTTQGVSPSWLLKSVHVRALGMHCVSSNKSIQVDEFHWGLFIFIFFDAFLFFFFVLLLIPNDWCLLILLICSINANSLVEQGPIHHAIWGLISVQQRLRQ
jgi:hypothetical protein